jgi:hypothetical protein
MKLSVKKNDERTRPKRDYYSTKETVMVIKYSTVQYTILFSRKNIMFFPRVIRPVCNYVLFCSVF